MADETEFDDNSSEESMESPIGGRKKLKPCKGQNCWNGSQGKASGKPKSKYSLDIPKKKVTTEVGEIPEPASHMNMRDLSGDAGDVSTYGQVNASGNMDYSTSEKNKMKGMEVNRTKVKKFFGK